MFISRECWTISKKQNKARYMSLPKNSKNIVDFKCGQRVINSINKETSLHNKTGTAGIYGVDNEKKDVKEFNTQ